MYCWVPPPGPVSAERTQGSGRNFSPAQGGAEALWAHPPASIPAKEGRSLLEVLITSPPSHPHYQLVVVVQSGLSQQDFRGLDREVKPVLASALAVPQPAGHSWDEPGSISSATDGKVDKTPSEIYRYILGGQGFLHSTETPLATARLPGCKHITELEGKTHWC